MTKFLNDDWMLENEFITQEEYDSKYFHDNSKVYGNDVLLRELDLIPVKGVNSNITVRDVLGEFINQKCDCVKKFKIF
jgi:hypothetical protein